MAKKWVEVESSPEYQSLPPESQAKAKQQYFETVVATKPEYANLEPDRQSAARQQFLGAEQEQAAPGATLEDFVSNMKQLMADNVKNQQLQQQESMQEQQRAAQQQAMEEQIRQIQDSDPKTWASSRFKRDFPKPRTAEEQVFYDMLLEEKVNKEKAIRSRIEDNQRAVLGILNAPAAAAQQGAKAGVPIGEKVGQEYLKAREGVTNKAMQFVPGTELADREIPISVPNPMAPAMPQANIPLGTTTPRKAVGELAGMGFDEVFTAGLGGATKLAMNVAKQSTQAVPLVKALPEIVRTGVSKGIKQSTGSIKDIKDIDRYFEDARVAVAAIYDNRKNLGLKDEAGEVVERLPETVMDMARAIDNTKGKVFKQYDDLTKQAGDTGAVVDLTKIGDDLTSELAKSKKVLNTIAPEAVSYAETRAAALRKAGSFTTEEAQDAIKMLNKSLETFYRNPSYDTASRAVVDAGIANYLRRALDDIIAQLPGGQYRALRNIYKSLKTIEKDVARRVVTESRRAGKQLIDFSDIFSGSEIVRGLIQMDPATVAAGTTAKTIAAVYKRLNSPNHAIKQMFRRYDQVFNEAVKRSRYGKEAAELAKTGAQAKAPGRGRSLLTMAAGSAAALTAAGKANAMGQEMPTNVDIDRIIQIESSGRSNVTSDEGAKGLMQIMDGGALGDWNRIHKDKKYTPKDMYDPVKNREVGTWYMNDMIPKYLKAWKFPDTIKNRLIFYNAGPGNGKKILRGKMTMDQETKDYIKKYGEQG